MPGYVYGKSSGARRRPAAAGSAPSEQKAPRSEVEQERKEQARAKIAQRKAEKVKAQAKKEAEAAATAPAVVESLPVQQAQTPPEQASEPAVMLTEQSVPAVDEAPDAVAVALESQRSRALIHELAREAVAQRVQELMEEAQQAADALRAEAMTEREKAEALLAEATVVREKAEALRAEAVQMRVDAEEELHGAQVLRENAEQSVQTAKQEIQAYGRQIVQQKERECAALIEQAQQILTNASDIELQAMELGRHQGYCIGLKEGRLKAQALAQLKAWPNQPTPEEDFSAQPVQEQSATDQSKELQP